MPNTPTQLFRGAASTTANTVLFTNSGAPNRTIATTVIVANTSTATQTFTLAADGTAFASAVNVSPNSTVVLDKLGIVLTGTQTLTGSASAITVNFLISGVVQS